MEVQLVIKAPNQNVVDHAVHCNLDWTVERLKNHLAETYPNRPVFQEQKLIYFGRLLSNDLHLRDILRHDENQSPVHVLHLVCNNNSYEQSSQTWKNTPTTSQVDSTSGQSSSTVRQRNVSSSATSNTLFSQFSQNMNPHSQATMSVFVPDSQVAAQIAAMQQMYTYYFTQYVQSVTPPSPLENNPVIPNISNSPQHAEVPAVRAQEDQRMNERPGGFVPEENDHWLRRDWLEHLFHCCRFLILFSVVYFYSTPERLLIVVIFALIAFLYQEGWFLVRRAQVVIPSPVPQPNPNNRENFPDFENRDDEPLLIDPDLSANDFGERELEAAMDGDDPPHAQQAGATPNNRIFSPLTFLFTFFSSLVPEPPPPVNIN